MVLVEASEEEEEEEEDPSCICLCLSPPLSREQKTTDALALFDRSSNGKREGDKTETFFSATQFRLGR